MYVYVPPPPSRNARDLGGRLADVVRDAKKQNKKLSYLEVTQAMRLAAREVRDELGGMTNRAQLLLVVALLFGICVAGVALALLTR